MNGSTISTMVMIAILVLPVVIIVRIVKKQGRKYEEATPECAVTNQALKSKLEEMQNNLDIFRVECAIAAVNEESGKLEHTEERQLQQIERAIARFKYDLYSVQ